MLQPYRPTEYATRFFTDYTGNIDGPLVIAFSAERGVQRIGAVNSHLWLSCQIGKHDLFQVRNVWRRTRKLLLEAETTGAYKEEELAEYPGRPRHHPSICNVRNEHVYLIGGLTDGSYTGTCYRYCLTFDFWAEMPSLCVPRQYHSSCVSGNCIFTVAGAGDDGTLNSIEVLRIADVPTEQIHEQWQLLGVSEEDLKPRWHPVVQPLNATEILIAGGFTGKCLNDTVIFDTVNLHFHNITQKGRLKFHALGNASAQVSENRIVALVHDYVDDPHMMEFNRGMPSVLTKKTC